MAKEEGDNLGVPTVKFGGLLHTTVHWWINGSRRPSLLCSNANTVWHYETLTRVLCMLCCRWVDASPSPPGSASELFAMKMSMSICSCEEVCFMQKHTDIVACLQEARGLLDLQVSVILSISTFFLFLSVSVSCIRDASQWMQFSNHGVWHHQYVDNTQWHSHCIWT